MKSHPDACDPLQPPPPSFGPVSDETIDRVVRTIVQGCNPDQIILFGSHATGRPTPGSDLDLLVVMPSSLPRHQRALAIRMLFRPSPCPMDILVYTREEMAYWMGTVNHIVTLCQESGRVLYERT